MAEELQRLHGPSAPLAGGRNKRSFCPSGLLFALPLPGAYNGRVMRIAKHTYFSLVAKYTYSPLVLVFSLGLMYSQVCNVICALSNCSAPATVRRAATVEPAGHCHQEQSPSQKDQPSDDQHECPAHASAVSILPSQTISTAVSHHAWQTAAAELVSSFDILFDFAGSGADRGGHFRSPPRRPLFTILRI